MSGDFPPIGEADFIPLEDLMANVASCAQCHGEIYADDDDALLCIECGGRNRRWPANKEGTP